MNPRPLLFPAVLALTACVNTVVNSALDLDGGPMGPSCELASPSSVDVLLVLDNSLSMAEEHANFTRNSTSLCKSTELCSRPCGIMTRLHALKQFMKEEEACTLPASEWATRFGGRGGEMANIWQDCGFFERMYLLNADYQVGVITSDMHDTDSLFHALDGGFPCNRDPAPQRGCLQRDPVTNSGLVTSKEGTLIENIAKFERIMNHVGTCGSGYERGFEAVQSFLDPERQPASPQCNQDAEQFLRTRGCLSSLPDGGCGQDGTESALVIIFMTDEDDCSHEGRFDENVSNTLRCHYEAETLKPVSAFTDFLVRQKSDPSLVRVGAILAGTYNEVGGFVPGSCTCNASGYLALPEATCRATLGRTNSTRHCGEMKPVPYCGYAPDPSTIPPGSPDAGPLPCCTADEAPRYHQLASGFARHALASTCDQEYRRALQSFAELVR